MSTILVPPERDQTNGIKIRSRSIASLEAIQRGLADLLLAKLDAIGVSKELFQASVFKGADQLNERRPALASKAVETKRSFTDEVVGLKKDTRKLLEGRKSDALVMDLRSTRVAYRVVILKH